MILLLMALLAPPTFPDHKLTIEAWPEKTSTGQPGWTARLTDSPICVANAATQQAARDVVCQQATQLGFSLNGGLLARINTQVQANGAKPMTHEREHIEAQHIEALPSIAQILAILNSLAPLLVELPKILAQIQTDLAALKAKP